MSGRFKTSLALATMLGSTAYLCPLFAHAESPAPANPPATAAPAKPSSPVQAEAAGANQAAASSEDQAAAKAAAADKAFADAKIAGLRAGLELTPAQAPLWPPVEAALRDVSRLPAWGHRGKAEGSADPLRDLARASDRMVERGKAIKALADATGPLLASLDADQKDRLPTLLDGMKPRRVLGAAFDLPKFDPPKQTRDGASGDRRGPYEHDRADHDRADMGGGGGDHGGGHHGDSARGGMDGQGGRYGDHRGGHDDREAEAGGDGMAHQGWDHHRTWDHRRDWNEHRDGDHRDDRSQRDDDHRDWGRRRDQGAPSRDFGSREGAHGWDRGDRDDRDAYNNRHDHDGDKGDRDTGPRGEDHHSHRDDDERT